VLVGHFGGTRGLRRLDFGIGDYAHLGVLCFFVISGFLITSLLLSEHAANRGISLKLFYVRRALRIFPASYAYIGCVSLLGLAGIIHLEAWDLVHAVTYTVNYAPHVSCLIGHLWSLSVEEQFYLLWPFAFVALGPRRAMWVAVGVILLGPVARSALRLFLYETPYYNIPMFPMVADSLAAGCLLAGARGWLENQPLYSQMFRPVLSVSLLVLILLLNRYMVYTAVDRAFGTSVVNVGLAILVHRSIYYPRD
jgi:peptidoglycan/LPS O-acetylase OafA/YrhL